jgi:hypothetical protein
MSEGLNKFIGPENFELPNGFTPEQVASVRMHLQNAMLFKRFENVADQGEKVDGVRKWFQLYNNDDSNLYTKVFNEYLGEHPDMLNDWEDPTKRETIISDVEDSLEKMNPWDEFSEEIPHDIAA